MPGQGDASDPAVQILSFARGSAAAAANRRSFQDASAIRIKQGSVAARVMPGDDHDTLELAEIGESTVLIRSSLRSANRPGVARAEILALLSRLGSSATERRASSFGWPGAPADVHASAAAAAKGPSFGKDLMQGSWLFSGSTYKQSSGRPDRRLRDAPVSVIWGAGGKATTGKVVHDTQRYWKHAVTLPRYPPGADMKSLTRCRDPRGVFFRADASKPDIGQFEQSDSHGYMSTSGPCMNGYFIRMYDSTVLQGLTHGKHKDEFVLAPIEHDKKTVHGSEVDLSYDKARYRYQKLMSSHLNVINHWKLNPESEFKHSHFKYHGYKYSGIVSQISFTRKKGGAPPPPPPPPPGKGGIANCFSKDHCWGFDGTAKVSGNKSAGAGYGKPDFVGIYVTGNTAVQTSVSHSDGPILMVSAGYYDESSPAAGRSAADAAAKFAGKLGAKAGKGYAIFLDYEGAATVNGQTRPVPLSAGYIEAWFDRLNTHGYLGGFYEPGNQARFTGPFCKAAQDDAKLASGAVIWSWQPQLGSTTKGASRSIPFSKVGKPTCSHGSTPNTIGWQYGQPSTSKNKANVDDDEWDPQHTNVFFQP